MAQSLSQLWIHIIFSTNKRHPFLQDPNIKNRLHDYIKSICFKQNCKYTIVGGMEDHVHVLTNLNKNLSISELVESIKKNSSKWLKTISNDDEKLREFYWQRGYGAFSVSHSNIKAVSQYIQNQAIHHSQKNFKDELKQLLIRHDLNFQEEYLWD